MNEDQETLAEAIKFLLLIHEMSPIVGKAGRDALILANKLNNIYPKLATKEEVSDNP